MEKPNASVCNINSLSQQTWIERTGWSPRMGRNIRMLLPKTNYRGYSTGTLACYDGYFQCEWEEAKLIRKALSAVLLWGHHAGIITQLLTVLLHGRCANTAIYCWTMKYSGSTVHLESACQAHTLALKVHSDLAFCFAVLDVYSVTVAALEWQKYPSKTPATIKCDKCVIYFFKNFSCVLNLINSPSDTCSCCSGGVKI